MFIADDSKTQLTYIKNILVEKSHNIDTATDGEMAEKMALSDKYDLVILDIVMPKKNGYEVCRVLKKSTQYKDRPILICSVKNLEIDKIWSMKQGASDFIVKPYKKDDLLASIEKYL
jgi:twitching motility two-component system response regulator PilH